MNSLFRFLVLACFLVLPGELLAGSLSLRGEAAQGGLLVGRVQPGSRVALDGTPVRVSKGGLFLLGFGREAPVQAELVVHFPDGGRERRSLTVRGRDFPVQRIDGLPEKKVTPDPEALKRIRADAAKIRAVRKRDTDAPFFESGFAVPVRGRTSGVFGSQRILNGKPRSPHRGLDIAAPRGTPVGATADGLVVLVADDMFYTGRTVMLDHGHGLASVYAHMDEVLVAEGQTVLKGAPIGTVGSSGRATGPHLHWGVSLFDVPLDPALLVPVEKAAAE